MLETAMGYMRRSLYILIDRCVDFPKVLGENKLRFIVCYDSIKLKTKPSNMP